MAASDLAGEDDNLETLLAKATNPLHKEPDPDAVAAFCSLIDKERDGPHVSLRLLAHKIQSPIEKESLMALSVLEECVKHCGIKFLSEVGKFRFLNEMIKVVSPKYLGNKASSKVKRKIVELMFLWSMELKNETKIFEAYQMLKRQGVVIEDPVYVLDNYEPPPPPPPRANKVPIFEDEENAQQLQKLLKSRNPEDLQAANRLIKNMVREADKRMELMAKRSTELETVHNNASVLADMLDHFRPGETSEEERDLMKELFESCERLRPKLFRLAGELDENDEGLSDILKANDELTVVINNYKKVTGMCAENGSSTKDTKKELSLLDLGSPTQEKPVASALLDDQLLALGLNDSDQKSSSLPSASSSHVSSASSSSSNALGDLSSVFATCSSTLSTNFSLTSTSTIGSENHLVKNQSLADSLLCGDAPHIPSLTPLQSSSIPAGSANDAPQNANPVLKGFEELDELGQKMLKNSLPASSSVKLEFPSNTPQKVPLSQLMQQQKLQPKADAAFPEIQPLDTSILSSKGQVLNKMSPASSPSHILSLKDVFVPLESVQPGNIPPLTIHDKNGLNVVIHFGKDSPRPDVTVMVVSTMSKNSSPVKNVNFQAAVPKSMKIKLQPPSATDLPTHNPILPPAAITQVMLLANPLKENVRLKYKVTYTMNESEFTDVGEVDSLFAPR